MFAGELCDLSDLVIFSILVVAVAPVNEPVIEFSMIIVQFPNRKTRLETQGVCLGYEGTVCIYCNLVNNSMKSS